MSCFESCRVRELSSQSDVFCLIKRKKRKLCIVLFEKVVGNKTFNSTQLISAPKCNSARATSVVNEYFCTSAEDFVNAALSRCKEKSKEKKEKKEKVGRRPSLFQWFDFDKIKGIELQLQESS